MREKRQFVGDGKGKKDTRDSDRREECMAGHE